MLSQRKNHANPKMHRLVPVMLSAILMLVCTACSKGTGGNNISNQGVTANGSETHNSTQAGHVSLSPFHITQTVSTGKNYYNIALAIKADGSLWAWGANVGFAQLS